MIHNILVRTCNVCDIVVFSVEIMSTLKVIKSILKWSYDKRNLTLMVISYEIYESLINFIWNDHSCKILYLLAKLASIFNLICYIPQIYGTGEQTRSFQYVTDLVDGLIALMNSNYSQPVNLGNPDEYTVRQFADIIKKYIGKYSLLENIFYF